MEELVNLGSFYKGRRVFITGHTGFKGSWLCLWLHKLGAEVVGYALDPPTDPSLFELCGVDKLVHSIISDVRDLKALKLAISEARPEIVIHMAAQPLVRDSYANPVETYEINVMGTVNLLEAVRTCPEIRAVVNITTDKCYENREWNWGYRENEPLGGYDPYSSSKACSELVTSAYRDSFFNLEKFAVHGVALASARAGNVIGGGDWGKDRLLPDCFRSLLSGRKILIRNPEAIRPWQHVLEPLSGYLLLAKRLYEKGPLYVGAWNYGPFDDDAKQVEWLVQRICDKWGDSAGYEVTHGNHSHEAHYLKLDCSKAKAVLDWHPCWRLETAIDKVMEWYKAYGAGENIEGLRNICFQQIEEYLALRSKR
ncbi:CDP-glucose 4,6-dehydratase [Desulfohalobiaceae bacterium Ax17]|uniref:CDP-glucose 4,6-dehydratase n=1 Tax=Desulfovulcanus ferrireducens TaxID=2831190 RepID=UPI00207BA446|nr:CDP-glucose 4,6-dehydratase [Desulfovulcanus ferrireducens]MBT8763354.1 CDP-glucose 4,6-dehydratase [Desulfovulcanus ferrireducens]